MNGWMHVRMNAAVRHVSGKVETKKGTETGPRGAAAQYVAHFQQSRK